MTLYFLGAKLTLTLAIPEDEVELLDEGTSLACDATIEIIKNGVDSAMNKYNKKKDV